MRTTALTFLAVGAAVLTPTLLTEAAAAGVPIPAYESASQRAALASLRASPIAGVPVVLSHGLTAQAYHEVQAGLRPLRGAVDATAAKLTAADAIALLERMLGAAKAGIAVGGVASYRVTTATSVFMGPTGLIRPGEPGDVHVQQTVANLLDTDLDGGDYTLTSLGAAYLVAARELNRLRIGVGLTPWTGFKASALLAAALAQELDDIGHRITGAPPDPSTDYGGAVGAAWDASVDFVTGIPGELAGAAAEGAAAAVLSRVGLVALAGYLAWRYLA